MTDLPDAETAWENYGGELMPEQQTDDVWRAFKAGFAAASGPWAEQLDAAKAEAEFWKANDNKRSAKVRKMRAERDELRAKYAELEAAYTAEGACGAIGCRAIDQRDALRAELDNLRDRVNALADEWDGKARMATDQANAMSSDRRQPYLMDSAKYLRRASELRAIVRGSDDE